MSLWLLSTSNGVGGGHRNGLVHLSLHLSFTLLWFLHISRQTDEEIDLKLGGCIYQGTPQAWLTFINFCLFPVISWPLIGLAVPSHLQINCWSDWAQIWWTDSLWASHGPINFWLCSTESQLWFTYSDLILNGEHASIVIYLCNNFYTFQMSIPLMDIALECLSTVQGDMQQSYQLIPPEIKANAR